MSDDSVGLLNPLLYNGQFAFCLLVFAFYFMLCPLTSSNSREGTSIRVPSLLLEEAFRKCASLSDSWPLACIMADFRLIYYLCSLIYENVIHKHYIILHGIVISNL